MKIILDVLDELGESGENAGEFKDDRKFCGEERVCSGRTGAPIAGHCSVDGLHKDKLPFQTRSWFLACEDWGNGCIGLPIVTSSKIQ